MLCIKVAYSVDNARVLLFGMGGNLLNLLGGNRRRLFRGYC